mmetsp:Transcript_45378/g.67379  ORF Transcript_45378/g.67379 Transcript_45378/m.67379 type:complete len:133 (-) Transcript_45378:380-778(-)
MCWAWPSSSPSEHYNSIGYSTDMHISLNFAKRLLTFVGIPRRSRTSCSVSTSNVFNIGKVDAASVGEQRHPNAQAEYIATNTASPLLADLQSVMTPKVDFCLRTSTSELRFMLGRLHALYQVLLGGHHYGRL